MEAGGEGALQEFHSVINALRVAYPEVRWDPNKLAKRLARGYWLNPINQRKFLDDIGRDLGVMEVIPCIEATHRILS